VEEIQYLAFENCFVLNNINLPNIKKVSVDSFERCYNLFNFVSPTHSYDCTNLCLVEGVSVGRVCVWGRNSESEKMMKIKQL
jgi:hypothetical protein